MRKMFAFLALLIPGFCLSATPTPIPTPYVDVVVPTMGPYQTSVTLAVAQVTKVIDPAIVGTYTVNLFKSDAYSSPVYGRFDYETMNVVSWQPTPRILTVQRAQWNTTSATWKKGTYSYRAYADMPTLTPTDTPTNTFTPTSTFTPTVTSTTTLVTIQADTITSRDGTTTFSDNVFANQFLSGSWANALKVTYIGDSIVFGYGGTAPFSSYVTYGTINGRAASVTNMGVSGMHIYPGMNDTGTYCEQVQNLSDENVAIVKAGINDLGDVQPDVAYASMKALCLHLRRCGYTRIIVGTLASARERDAARVTYNTYIRAGWPTFADEMFDVGADPNIGPLEAYTNTTYFTEDGIHPKDAGYVVIASVCQAAINRLWSKIQRADYAPILGTTPPTPAPDFVGQFYLDTTGPTTLWYGSNVATPTWLQMHP